MKIRVAGLGEGLMSCHWHTINAVISSGMVFELNVGQKRAGDTWYYHLHKSSALGFIACCLCIGEEGGSGLAALGSGAAD